jgi:hypothetical protein
VSKIGKEDFLENLTIKELSILYMQAIPIISLLNLE